MKDNQVAINFILIITQLGKILRSKSWRSKGDRDKIFALIVEEGINKPEPSDWFEKLH